MLKLKAKIEMATMLKKNSWSMLAKILSIDA